MKEMLSIIFILLLSTIISGCAPSGYSQYYKYFDEGAFAKIKNDPRLEYLKDGEEPKILLSNDLQKDILLYRSKKYIPIGYSSFNGNLESEKEIISQAKKIGAVLVLYNWQYTNTQQNSGVMMLPTTNYSTTNIYGYGSGSMYNGTAYTKSSGTQMVPYSNTQRRYNQEAIYFLKTTFDYPFGTQGTTPITREERITIGTNGMKVNCIIENTPAYNSDLMINDIIISINNQKIENSDDYNKLTDMCVNSKNVCILKVIRDKEEKEIKIKF